MASWPRDPGEIGAGEDGVLPNGPRLDTNDDARVHVGGCIRKPLTDLVPGVGRARLCFDSRVLIVVMLDAFSRVDDDRWVPRVRCGMSTVMDDERRRCRCAMMFHCLAHVLSLCHASSLSSSLTAWTHDSLIPPTTNQSTISLYSTHASTAISQSTNGAVRERMCHTRRRRRRSRLHIPLPRGHAGPWPTAPPARMLAPTPRSGRRSCEWGFGRIGWAEGSVAHDRDGGLAEGEMERWIGEKRLGLWVAVVRSMAS